MLKRYASRFGLSLVSSCAAGVLAVVSVLSAANTDGRSRPAIVILALLFLATFAVTLTKALQDRSATEQASKATGDIAAELQHFIGRLQELTRLLDRMASSDGSQRRGLLATLEAAVVGTAQTVYGRDGLRAVVYHLDGDMLRPGDIQMGWGEASPKVLYRGYEDGMAAFELLSRRRPVWVDNVNDARHRVQLDLGPRDRFNAFARIPIVAGGRTLGILWVDGLEAHSLTEGDTQALAVLAQLLGVGMAIAKKPVG